MDELTVVLDYHLTSPKKLSCKDHTCQAWIEIDGNDEK